MHRAYGYQPLTCLHCLDRQGSPMHCDQPSSVLFIPLLCYADPKRRSCSYCGVSVVSAKALLSIALWFDYRSVLWRSLPWLLFTCIYRLKWTCIPGKLLGPWIDMVSVTRCCKYFGRNQIHMYCHGMMTYTHSCWSWWSVAFCLSDSPSTLMIQHLIDYSWIVMGLIL